MTNKTADRAVDAVLEMLAVYRATKLLQEDDLPPLPEIRAKLMAKYEDSPWSALLDCPWCLSVWVGMGSALLRRVAPRLWRVLAGVLASSAATGVITSWLDSLEPRVEIGHVEHLDTDTADDIEALADQVREPKIH
jgi:Protein of unknown function (DUF1360)